MNSTASDSRKKTKHNKQKSVSRESAQLNESDSETSENKESDRTNISTDDVSCNNSASDKECLNESRTNNQEIEEQKYFVLDSIARPPRYPSDIDKSPHEDNEFNDVNVTANNATRNNEDITANEVNEEIAPIEHITNKPISIKTIDPSQSIENDKLIEAQSDGGTKRVYNTRALPKTADTYELEKFEKNALLIFNQVNFLNNYLYKPRTYSHKDAANLRTTFENYNFEIEEKEDQYRSAIFEKLDEFANRNFTDYGCIAVAVLTHGSEMGALNARDKEFYESDIVNFFNASKNLTLVTKPILFIIQACRGIHLSNSVPVGQSEHMHKDNKMDIVNYHIPLECDMMTFNSSFPGRISISHELQGSWFIQTLCAKINELAATHDINGIATAVKKTVSIEKEYTEYNRRLESYVKYKQIPTIQSTFTRALFLRKNPKIPEDAGLRRSISLPQTSFSCSCDLEVFSYLKRILRHFVEENPNDVRAASYLDVANAFTESHKFHESKKKMARVIRNHLKMAAKDSNYYMFLYLHQD